MPSTLGTKEMHPVQKHVALCVLRNPGFAFGRALVGVDSLAYEKIGLLLCLLPVVFYNNDDDNCRLTIVLVDAKHFFGGHRTFAG